MSERLVNWIIYAALALFALAACQNMMPERSSSPVGEPRPPAMCDPDPNGWGC